MGKTNNLHMRKQRRRSASFVFATQIVQSLLYLTPKFQASSSFLCLYRSVCVGPVRKPLWFSHAAAHFLSTGQFINVAEPLRGLFLHHKNMSVQCAPL